MFSKEKYYSPSRDREIDYDEFKEFSCEQMNLMMDEDMKIYKEMVEEDPCRTRGKLGRGLFNYSTWLIRDNLELYKCSLENRLRPIADLQRKAFSLTKIRTYTFEYNISSEVSIPFDKVIEGTVYSPLKGKKEELVGVRISNVHSNDDDLSNARSLGERKLNQFLGFLALYSNELSTKVGQWNGSYVDECGESMYLAGTVPATLKQIFWERYDPLDLKKIEEFSFGQGILLDLLYVAAISEYSELWRGAYLNYYLSLETLATFGKIEIGDFKEYKWVRNSIAHSKLDLSRGNEEMFNFLRNEFGSEVPDWGDTNNLTKLGNWTRKLKAQLRLTIFG